MVRHGKRSCTVHVHPEQLVHPSGQSRSRSCIDRCMKARALPLLTVSVALGVKACASAVSARLTFVVVSGLFVLGVSSAEAGTMTTWHWAGPVTGYQFALHCPPGEDCGPRLESVVPLGTNVDVIVSLDPAAAPNANCLAGTAAATLQVLGRTYTRTGFVWVDGMGFGPGVCAPGSNRVEVVVPGWGSSGPELPDGWVTAPPIGDSFPGLWWGGDLADGQPISIGHQFPFFWQPFASRRQAFIADLQAVPATVHSVPEPATMLLFGAGLATLAARKYRRCD